MDINALPGTYASGNCRWQSAEEYGLKAVELDTANISTTENYALAMHYIIKGEYEKTIKYMSQTPAPGFLWYDLYMGTSHDGLGNNEKAAEHFESIKKTLGDNKLDTVKKNFEFWNVLDNYYPSFGVVLAKHGFE